MNTPFFHNLLAHYHWGLSLITGLLIIAITVGTNRLLGLVPTIGKAQKLNQTTFRGKMERPNYAANLKWNQKWSSLFLAVIFVMILPFCLSASAQPWWHMPRDLVVILMAYDFVYYFTHRFVFHDNGFLGGPMLKIHGVHHRQHNPCRWDASYIHPAESAVGLSLFLGTIFVLSFFMGNFSVVTVAISWFVFTELNLHNHDLWEADRFPFKYLNYASKLHHTHHETFIGGNFATISPLYDWMFGTLDHGKGYRANAKVVAPAAGE